MPRVFLCIVMAACLSLAACASTSRDPYKVYGNPYTRPGTTRVQADKDFRTCADVAEKKTMGTQDTWRGMRQDKIIDKCMRGKGYRK